MSNLQQIEERYLGGQSIVEFVAQGSDVRTYARKVFAGEIFGTEDPAAPDLDIHDEYDLIVALIALGEAQGAFAPDRLGVRAGYNAAWAAAARRVAALEAMSDDELLAYDAADEDARVDWVRELNRRPSVPQPRLIAGAYRLPVDAAQAREWTADHAQVEE